MDEMEKNHLHSIDDKPYTLGSIEGAPRLLTGKSMNLIKFSLQTSAVLYENLCSNDVLIDAFIKQ